MRSHEERVAAVRQRITQEEQKKRPPAREKSKEMEV